MTKNKYFWMKWVAILVILISVTLIILGISKNAPNKFYFGNWTESSSSSIVDNSSSMSGEGQLQNRVKQLLIAFFGGGSLAIAGTILQKVTKNRLAEVSILGIGSINILFIYLYINFVGIDSFGNGPLAILMPIFLIMTSVIGTLIIWLISKNKNTNKNTFVIIGIAIQLFVEALSVIIINPTKISATPEGKRIWGRIKSYTLGQIRNNPTHDNNVQWWLLIVSIILITIIIIIAIFIRRKIDTYEISESITKSTGISPNKLRLILYILIAILAGVSSAIIGTISLLGIIAPSISRLLFKNKFAPLFICSFLIGGILVMFSSWLTFNLEVDLPVGILSTAIIAPYFIFLILKERT